MAINKYEIYIGDIVYTVRAPQILRAYIILDSVLKDGILRRPYRIKLNGGWFPDESYIDRSWERYEKWKARRSA